MSGFFYALSVRRYVLSPDIVFPGNLATQFIQANRTVSVMQDDF
jgi:hypothetical protein